MEYKQMTLAEWLDIKQKLKQDISSAKDKLNGLKKDFVRIGYLLRKIDDNDYTSKMAIKVSQNLRKQNVAYLRQIQQDSFR